VKREPRLLVVLGREHRADLDLADVVRELRANGDHGTAADIEHAARSSRGAEPVLSAPEVPSSSRSGGSIP
jgi:hypothetical protein